MSYVENPVQQYLRAGYPVDKKFGPYADIAARNAIPAEDRYPMMMAGVLDIDGAGTNGIFYLYNGITNADWQPVGSGASGEGAFPAIYVAETGDDTNSGSFTEPLATLQEAVAQALSGQNIYMKPGTYSEGFVIDKDVNIYSIEDGVIDPQTKNPLIYIGAAIITINAGVRVHMQGIKGGTIYSSSDYFTMKSCEFGEIRAKDATMEFCDIGALKPHLVTSSFIVRNTDINNIQSYTQAFTLDMYGGRLGQILGNASYAMTVGIHNGYMNTLSLAAANHTVSLFNSFITGAANAHSGTINATMSGIGTPTDVTFVTPNLWDESSGVLKAFSESITTDAENVYPDQTMNGDWNFVKDASVVDNQGLLNGVSFKFTYQSGSINFTSDFDVIGDILEVGEKYLFVAVWYGLSFSVAYKKFGVSTPLTTLTAPSILYVTAENTTSMTVTCNDPNTSPQETYVLFRRATNSGMTSGLITSLQAAGTTSHQFTGLTFGVTYYYDVIAKGDGLATSDSDPSTVDSRVAEELFTDTFADLTNWVVTNPDPTKVSFAATGGSFVASALGTGTTGTFDNNAKNNVEYTGAIVNVNLGLDPTANYRGISIFNMTDDARTNAVRLSNSSVNLGKMVIVTVIGGAVNVYEESGYDFNDRYKIDLSGLLKVYHWNGASWDLIDGTGKWENVDTSSLALKPEFIKAGHATLTQDVSCTQVDITSYNYTTITQ